MLNRNRLLAPVHANELARFADLFQLRDFEAGEVVSEPGETVVEIIFPIDSLFSVVAETRDGDQVEAGTVGYDGVVGRGRAEDLLLSLQMDVLANGADPELLHQVTEARRTVRAEASPSARQRSGTGH
ncbi:MAG: hypothetical protein KY392_02125 [Chloroflexi bacterium]|nr:hypothetical protein [Chloroflexota bacterium]